MLLLAAWFGVGSLTAGQFVFAIAVAVLGAAWALAELYSIARGRGDYIELLPDAILLAFALQPWSIRIWYGTIASAELRDRWSDRAARCLLRMIGRSNPPRVELRFRERLRFGWWPWRLKRIYVRPMDPEVVVGALSARLGAT